PLHQRDLVAVTQLFPAELPHVVGIVEPVEVEVCDGAPGRRSVAEDEIERGRRHRRVDACTARERPREHRLPRPPPAAGCDADAPSDGARKGYLPASTLRKRMPDIRTPDTPPRPSGSNTSV